MPENNSDLLPDLPATSDGQVSYPRRSFLLSSGSVALMSAALAPALATAQNIEKNTEAEHGKSASDVGPENTGLKDVSPNSFVPPPTDHGEVETFWSSFSSAHRRIQEGGWSRQVTVADFPISKTIAGVNMRLTVGGVRELHWHDAAEWALMLSGKARITAIDNEGRSFVKDVGKDDLWFFPSGTPHFIQGLGPDGCEFLLVFDDGKFSEGNTTLLSDWTRHTPREVLAKNWGVPENVLDSVYQVPPDGKYIFQAPVPRSLEEDQRAAAGNKGPSPLAFDFSLSTVTPVTNNKSGEVRIVDSRSFKVSNTIAAAHVIVKPGGLRELHWHQNADEWQYYIAGKGRMTVFFNGAKARTADFNGGDVGYIPKTFGHYIENVGDSDLVLLEMFRSDRYQDLSLSDWITHTPPELVMAHLGISKETLARIPKNKLNLTPI